MWISLLRCVRGAQCDRSGRRIPRDNEAPSHLPYLSLIHIFAVFAATAVPLAFLAAALSAFVGSLLPQALARITAAAAWCVVVCFTTFAPMPVGASRSKMGVVTDAICQGFFGCQPVIDLDVMGGSAAYTAFDAALLLVLRIALALALVAAAALISRKRNFQRK